MDEFIKKLIERLEELQNYACFPCEFVSEEQEEVYSFFRTQLTEILEFAKENQSSWIACSERLPEVNGKYLVCIDNPTRNKKDCIFVFWFNAYDKEFEREHDLDYVLAWQPLPIPYRLKGNETVTNCNALKMETADNEQI